MGATLVCFFTARVHHAVVLFYNTAASTDHKQPRGGDLTSTKTAAFLALLACPVAGPSLSELPGPTRVRLHVIENNKGVRPLPGFISVLHSAVYQLWRFETMLDGGLCREVCGTPRL